MLSIININEIIFIFQNIYHTLSKSVEYLFHFPLLSKDVLKLNSLYIVPLDQNALVLKINLMLA